MAYPSNKHLDAIIIKKSSNFWSKLLKGILCQSTSTSSLLRYFWPLWATVQYHNRSDPTRSRFMDTEVPCYVFFSLLLTMIYWHDNEPGGSQLRVVGRTWDSQWLVKDKPIQKVKKPSTEMGARPWTGLVPRAWLELSWLQHDSCYVEDAG